VRGLNRPFYEGAIVPQIVKGESMGVTAFPHPVTSSTYPNSDAETGMQQQENPDWMGITIGGTLLVGSLLLLSGKKRAGLVATAAATALTALDQQETIREWWNMLPQYLDEAQRLLDQAQNTIDDLAAKRERLLAMFNR
jgi:hypothetical protein